MLEKSTSFKRNPFPLPPSSAHLIFILSLSDLMLRVSPGIRTQGIIGLSYRSLFLFIITHRLMNYKLSSVRSALSFPINDTTKNSTATISSSPYRRKVPSTSHTNDIVYLYSVKQYENTILLLFVGEIQLKFRRILQALIIIIIIEALSNTFLLQV